MSSGEVIAMTGAHQGGEYDGVNIPVRNRLWRERQYQKFTEEEILRFDIEERKILYACGCADQDRTVKRMEWITQMIVERSCKNRILNLSMKIQHGFSEQQYSNFYRSVKSQMNDYFQAQSRCNAIESDAECCI